VFAVHLVSLAARAAGLADIEVIAVDLPFGLPDCGLRQDEVVDFGAVTA
jgi:hypothetical protein